MEKVPEKPRVALMTLGCKVNQYESAALHDAMVRMGFQTVSFPEEADCYIVNTCTVTARTDCQSRQLIRRALRRNPQAFVVATGCYAQTKKEALAEIPGVSLIAGNREKAFLPEIVSRWWNEKTRNPAGPATFGIPAEIRSEEDAIWVPPVQQFPGHTRAFLKIQDGCNAFCSYCIVPHARGRSRSLDPATVYARLQELARAGHREVVLTGIHLGAYGQDLTPSTNLVHLVRRIEEQKMVARLRLSSLEPLEISDELLRLLSAATVLCPHLHIPLQSGDNAILSRMNRHYDRTFFRTLIERIIASRPDVALGVDVMVGFPGEDEAAFEQTYRLLDELPVAYLHVFPFSKRPGTPACLMKDQVKEEEKKRRVRQLRTLDDEKRRLFMTPFIGQPLQVLVEGRRDKSSGCLSGFSQNYIPVTVANGRPQMVNAVTTVMPLAMVGNKLYGEAIHE